MCKKQLECDSDEAASPHYTLAMMLQRKYYPGQALDLQVTKACGTFFEGQFHCTQLDVKDIEWPKL